MRASALLLGLSFSTAIGACSAPTRPRTTELPPAPSSAASVYGQAASPAPAPATTTSPIGDVLLPTLNSDVSLPTASQMRARPISGGTLRILSDGHTAVAADSDRDQVYVVDLRSAELTSTVALAAGDEPGRVVEDAAGRVHVALRSGGGVATIDPLTGTLLARRALCAAPRGLAVDAATQTLHVACAGGELVSIAADPTTETPSRTLHLERDLRDVVVKGDRLFVSTFRSAQVLVVDATGAMTARLAMPNRIDGAASVAWRMVEGPANGLVMLHQRSSVNVIGTSAGAYGQRNGSCRTGIVSSVVTVIPDDGSSIASGPSLQGAVAAADAAFSPDGSQMAVVALGGDGDGQGQLQFFDSSVTFSGQGTSNVGCSVVAAPVPQANAVEQGGGDQTGLLPNAGRYLPANGQIVAVAYDPRGNVVVQSREPASLQILTQRVEPILLSTDSRFDAGHLLFHTATASQIACVSCHPEGGEDGRVWQFQTLGARRTQSLRGGIMDTAPFHWNGDESGLTAIMADVFQVRMGGAQVDTAGVAALSRWMAQIPTIPVSRWSDDATVARGKATFASAGCAACHAGADFTNGLNVDVGTGQTFQVPQLHGIGFRAPYMHNGCAVTLRDRFTLGTCGGDARHGAVAMLSSGQVTDLIAYLDTL